MGKMKKLLTTILCIFLVVGLVPVTGFNQNYNTAFAETDFTGWTILTTSTSIEDEGRYYLTDDIERDISIGNGIVVTIDLNGHVLKGTGNDSVITNMGTLTIADSQNDNVSTRYFTDEKCEHGIQVGENCGSCIGGVALKDGCFETYSYSKPNTGIEGKDYLAITGGVITGGIGHKYSLQGKAYGGAIVNVGNLTLNAGNIVGNIATEGGGVENDENFVMNGGLIAGNAAVNGGGIANYKRCTVSDGTISNNTALLGGGVYNIHASDVYLGSFAMNGGHIINNDARTKGGGLYIQEDASVSLGGNAVIKDNICSDKKNNLYLPSGKSITVLDAPNAPQNMSVGISLENMGSAVTYDTNINYLHCFKSDSEELIPVFDAGRVYFSYIIEDGQALASASNLASDVMTNADIFHWSITKDISVEDTVKISTNCEKFVIYGNNHAITADKGNEASATDSIKHVLSFENEHVVSPIVEINDLTVRVKDGFRNGIYFGVTKIGKAINVALNNVSVIMDREKSPVKEAAATFGVPIQNNSCSITVTGKLNIETDEYCWAAMDLDKSRGDVSLAFDTNTNIYVNFTDKRTTEKESVEPLIGKSDADNPTSNKWIVTGYEGVNVPLANSKKEKKGLDLAAFKVGNTKYASLELALKKKPDSENSSTPTTITLISDANGDVTIKSGRNIVLDLNGHVLQGTGTASVITNKGTLTITDTQNDNVSMRYFTDEKCEHGIKVGENCGSCIGGVALKDGCFETYSSFIPENGTEGQDYITVKGGVITGGNNSSYGGAIFNIPSTNSVYLTLEGGNLVGNKAGLGGAIYSTDKTDPKLAYFTMTGGSILGNLATKEDNAYGGGIYLKCSASMTGGEVSYNTVTSATTNKKASGGGIYIDKGSKVSSFSNMKICGNNSKAIGECLKAYGGGISAGYTVEEAPLEIANCIISDNTVSARGEKTAGTSIAYGGGLYLGQSVKLTGFTAIKNNIAKVETEFNDDDSLRQAFGGGIYIARGTETNITNLSIESDAAHISGNMAQSTYKVQGGGLYLEKYNSLSMYQGSITNNIVKVVNDEKVNEEEGGGVCVTYNGTIINVGGTAQIINNYGSSANQNNVYLRSDVTSPAISVTNPQSMKIGITVDEKLTQNLPVIITTAKTDDYSSFFFADDSSKYHISSQKNETEKDKTEVTFVLKPKQEYFPGNPTYDVSVSGDKTAVKVQATISGEIATINNLTEEQIKNVGTSEEVVVDLSNLSSNVTGAVISKATIDNVAKSDATGLTIKMPNGVSTTFDATTLNAVSQQASGEKIKLVVDKDNKAEQAMTSAQKETLKTLKNAAVIDAYFVSNGSRISDFKGGKAYITVPYKKKGTGKVTGSFLADNGEKTTVNTTYDSKGKLATLEVFHFSNYVVEEADAKIKQDEVVSAVSKLKIKANTKYVTYKGKKTIQVYTTVLEGKKELSSILENGYTAKYVFYRSTGTKISSFKKAYTSESDKYLNTKGTKGKKYYYRAQIKVYDQNGSLVAATTLKNCKYGTKVFK